MKPTHGFKIQLNIASLIGAIFICWVCLGGVQTVRATEPSSPVQGGVDMQINSQGASTEWQMPMDVATVANAGRVQTQGTVEVVEFFWYGCPHCAVFEPAFAQWRAAQPQTVQIITLPISWNKAMVTHQRMYFTLEALNRLDLHDRVFRDVAATKNSITTPESALAWARKQGISPSTWRATFSSAAVTRKMQFAQTQFERFGLTGVPAVIVDGRYQVLLSANTIETLDALVKQRLSNAK